MANLTSAGVTIHDSWTEDGPNSRYFIGRRVTLALTGQGNTTNTIPASALSLSSLVSSSPAVLANNTGVLVTTPSADGTLLLINEVSGNGSLVPGNISGNYTVVVRGTRTV